MRAVVIHPDSMTIVRATFDRRRWYPKNGLRPVSRGMAAIRNHDANATLG